MQIFTPAEFKSHSKELNSKIKKGAVFIAPTDTIYGLHCNAILDDSVSKIRKIKQRPDSPLSVWIPSISWAKKNCLLSLGAEEWLRRLPGPYTLILPLREKKAVAKTVSPQQKSLGIRLPKHWFSKIVAELNIPLVTTSANKTNQPFMTSLENLDPEIAAEVDFIIYEGAKEARPSKIVDLTTGEIKDR